jgi:two-component system, NarL family, sensor histidine kinase UhpB
MSTSRQAPLSSATEPDPPSATAPAPAAHGRQWTRWRWRWEPASLLWRVFAANVVVSVLAFAALAWAPVKVDPVATPSELLILSGGLILMLAIDLVLLRHTFGPLRRLAALMTAVDPTQPGRRASISDNAATEVIALGHALNAMLDRLEDERRESGRRALAAQESERMRIARELHDEVGQSLTAVALRAERAAGTTADHEQAFSEIAETVLRSLEDVHRIGRELRPEALDDLGLVSALVALCTRVARQGTVRVRRELDWQLCPLPGEVELVIYRVAQEALTNVLRHAQATEAMVSLKGVAGGVQLMVTDDGIGLPAGNRESGIAGMRERALLIDATFEVRSAPGAGTEVVLWVPAARTPSW